MFLSNLSSENYIYLYMSLLNMFFNNHYLLICLKLLLLLLLFAEVNDQMKKTEHLPTLRYYWLQFHNHFDRYSKEQFREMAKLIRVASESNGK